MTPTHNMAIKLVILQAILVATLFILPEFSRSRSLLENNGAIENGFRVDLRHVHAKGNYTKIEFVQRAVKRGRNRLARLNAAVLDSSTGDVQSPVHTGNGEFLMDLAIGTPSLSYSAIMDTGSDLIWTQCKPCDDCYKQPTPIFDPSQSSTFSKVACSSKLCSALSMSTCDSGCNYMYAYGDYSTTQGVIATETFTFGEATVPNIGFGCGSDNEGSGFTQGGGLVGLGRGPLSLVSQLGSGLFSYCLTSVEDSKSSSLLFGSLASKGTNSATKTTPLIKNPTQPSFYYLSLEGISVGGTLLSIPKSTFALNTDGTGGLIIDSGTTITYLEQSGFKLVKSAFESKMNLPVDSSGSTGLDLCFTLPSDTSSLDVPSLTFHFKGADIDLPADNYMIADSSVGLICLAMGASSGMSVFGNIQQQNTLVLHDLDKETVSFTPTLCDQL